jgi:hypothetical protein
LTLLKKLLNDKSNTVCIYALRTLAHFAENTNSEIVIEVLKIVASRANSFIENKIPREVYDELAKTLGCFAENTNPEIIEITLTTLKLLVDNSANLSSTEISYTIKALSGFAKNENTEVQKSAVELIASYTIFNNDSINMDIATAFRGFSGSTDEKVTNIIFETLKQFIFEDVFCVVRNSLETLSAFSNNDCASISQAALEVIKVSFDSTDEKIQIHARAALEHTVKQKGSKTTENDLTAIIELFDIANWLVNDFNTGVLNCFIADKRDNILTKVSAIFKQCHYYGNDVTQNRVVSILTLFEDNDNEGFQKIRKEIFEEFKKKSLTKTE